MDNVTEALPTQPEPYDPILAVADAALAGTTITHETNDPILAVADEAGVEMITPEAKERAFVSLKGPRSRFTTNKKSYKTRSLKAQARREDQEQMGAMWEDTALARVVQAEMRDWERAAEMGYDESIVGMYAQKKAPVPTNEKLTLRQQFIKEIVAGSLDAPVSVAGAAPGIFTMNPLAALGGAGAAPATLRQWLIDEYTLEPEVSQMELGERLQRSLWEGTKAGAVSMAGGKAGEKMGTAVKGVWGATAGRLAQIPTELVAGTTAHSIVMNGGLPTMEDFRMSAISLAAGHATHAAGAPLRNQMADARLRQKSHMEAKLMHIYEETGLHPNAVMKMAREDETLRAQLVSAHEGVPDALMGGPREKIDTGERPTRDLKEDVKGVKQWAEDKFVDDLGPIRRFVDEVEGKGAAAELDAKRNPYKQARVARGWMGKVEHIMEHGGWDLKTGDTDGTKGMLQILRNAHNPEAGKSLQGFAEYLVSRRAVELEKRAHKSRRKLRQEVRDLRRRMAENVGNKAEYSKLSKRMGKLQSEMQGKLDAKNANEVTGFRQYDLKEVIKRGDALYKHDAADFRALNSSVLKMQHEAGFLSKSEWNRIKNANQEYVPFKRLMDDMVKLGPKFDAEGKPLKTIEGSGRPLTNVLQQWAVDLQSTFRAIEHNRVVNMLADTDIKGATIKRLKLGKDHDAVSEVANRMGIKRSEVTAVDLMEATHGKESSVIYGYRDGKRYAYEVPEGIARAMNNLTGREWSPKSPGGRFLHKILKAPATLLRGGATSSPDFMAANVVRDISSAFAFSENGNRHIRSFAEGAYHAMKTTNTYKEWLRSGGAMGNLSSEHLGHLQGDVYRSLSERTLHNTVDMKKLWTIYQKIGGTAESATRVGEFIQAGRKGASLTERAYQSRDISLDFGKAGSWGRYINDLVAFHNAGIQSMAKLHHAFKRDPQGTALRVFGVVTLPSIVINTLFGDDERVKEVPQWERDLYWVLPIGDYLVRIPKPHEVGIIFGSSFERGLDAMRREDPHAWDGFRNSIMEKFGLSISPTIAEPYIESLTNHSFFTGNNLVPHYMEDVLPEFQRTTYTSATARKISSVIARGAEALGYDHGEGTVSPIMIDNLVQSWTAGMGRYATMGLDHFLRPKEEVPPEWRMEDLPVVRAFMIRSPKSSSRSMDAFMKRHKKAVRSWTTADGLLKAMDFENYNLVMNDQRWVKLDGIYDTIVTLRGLAYRIHNAKDGEFGLHGKELAHFKTEQLEEIYKQITMMGQCGLTAYDKLDQQIEQLKEWQWLNMKPSQTH
ncbi:LPD38 domain-containing protein [Desulfoluna spongiiphila]|uniref:Large polyvalent protein associated domain-containing protein n=1 Tax=Desulfoluna spongiiphila TaxID=419481 RepID=A0A1G5ADR1_9BACT|nr:LPD38 domain-containing protein [Desulfoluna spongiiphila]SCX75989.1 hypothetical protein SAMN05216233_10183 [Desulfoluna spongiiphila]